MDIRKFTEIYLPMLVLAGSGLLGYGALSNEVDNLKGTDKAVVRLEEQQKQTKEAVDKLDEKLDKILDELRKAN